MSLSLVTKMNDIESGKDRRGIGSHRMTDDRSLSVNFSEFSSYTLTSPLACSEESSWRMNGVYRTDANLSEDRAASVHWTTTSRQRSVWPTWSKCIAEHGSTLSSLRSLGIRENDINGHRINLKQPYRISLRLIFEHRSANEEDDESTVIAFASLHSTYLRVWLASLAGIAASI